MSISSINAGKTLCELSGWKISNLRLQKLLYIAHMYHIGDGHGELIDENFEAWIYGPVEPELYRYVRGYGKDPIRNVFMLHKGATEDSSEYTYLKDVIEATKELDSYVLVSFTHWEEGAWHKVYSRGKRNGIITTKLIMDEYNARRSKN